MNVFDPFYTGALPGTGAFIIGLALVLVVGWLYEKGKK